MDYAFQDSGQPLLLPHCSSPTLDGAFANGTTNTVGGAVRAALFPCSQALEIEAYAQSSSQALPLTIWESA